MSNFQQSLLEALTATCDEAWIQESPEEIVDAVLDLEIEGYAELHDENGNQLVRAFRTEEGFRLYHVAYDMSGLQTFFSLDLNEFESVEGYDHEAAKERREARHAVREATRATRAKQRLERFLLTERAYNEGAKGQRFPYLSKKRLKPATINIEYAVAKVSLSHNAEGELAPAQSCLIYKMNDNVYGCITASGHKQPVIRSEGDKSGSYSIVGDISKTPRFLTEGLADAISVNQATGDTVIVGIDAGNIKEVAKSFPGIILAGDNDDAGRKAASNAGIRGIFPSKFKDWDDMRMEKGLEYTGNSLRRELEKFQTNITATTSIPGSGKSYEYCLQTINKVSSITVYAVHSLAAMSQYEDSRIGMMRGIIANNTDLKMPTVHRVCSDEEDGVNHQFTSALKACSDKSDENHVIFITHMGLQMIDFATMEGVTADCIIDEVPEAYSIAKKTMMPEHLSTLLSCFYYDVSSDDDNYFINLSSKFTDFGRDYRDNHQERVSNTGGIHSIIRQHSNAANNEKFLLLPKASDEASICDMGHRFNVKFCRDKNKVELPSIGVYLCSLFKPEVFEMFRNVDILSDDCENSLLVLLLQRLKGLNINIKKMKSRHTNGVAHRIEKIIGITGHTFSKAKMDRNPAIATTIATILEKDYNVSNSLWLLNKKSGELGDAVEYLERKGYTVGDASNEGDYQVGHHSPITHGLNNLQTRNAVICMYSLKASPQESLMLQALGIDKDEITRWREWNIHMQNAFRGFLRNPDSDATGILVFPDAASIEYFLMRIKYEFGDSEYNACKNKVEYLMSSLLEAEFIAKKGGWREDTVRKTEDDKLSNKESKRLSAWRKDFPDLDKMIAEVYSSKKAAASMKKKEIKRDYLAWEAGELSEEDVNVATFQKTGSKIENTPVPPVPPVETEFDYNNIPGGFMV